VAKNTLDYVTRENTKDTLDYLPTKDWIPDLRGCLAQLLSERLKIEITFGDICALRLSFVSSATKTKKGAWPRY
jgi:hypothetical protein